MPVEPAADLKLVKHSLLIGDTETRRHGDTESRGRLSMAMVLPLSGCRSTLIMGGVARGAYATGWLLLRHC